MYLPNTPEDRALGAFIGLAVGDALGAAVEFQKKGTYEPLTTYRDGGPFNLTGGQWTDDTSQAICIAEWLQGQNPVTYGLRNRFAEWLFSGKNSSTDVAFDVGRATGKVLMEHRAGEVNPETLANSGGNGAIMRLAPVALKYRNDLTKGLFYAEMSGNSTHRHQSSKDSVRLLFTLLVGAIHKSCLRTDFIEFACLLLPVKSELRAQVLKLLDPNQHTEEIINIDGYSVTTLLAAMQALLNTDSFESCVLNAVNRGGDTDSVGAVAGQLAGAVYGYSEIPRKFLTKLWDHDRLVQLATALID